MGLSSARTHPLQTPASSQFWPPPPNTQQLQFRSLPKIELLFPLTFDLLSSSFYQTLAFISVFFIPLYIYTHTYTHTLTVFTSFQLNFPPSPLLDEWLIFSWKRLSLWPIFPYFLFFIFFTFIRSVLAKCSMTYGDYLRYPLLPVGWLAARMDILMDEYMKGLLLLRATG